MLHDGIGQQLSKRARRASHHPAQVPREVAPPESIGLADLNTPANQSGSSTHKAQPIFEIGDA